MKYWLELLASAVSLAASGLLLHRHVILGNRIRSYILSAMCGGYIGTFVFYLVHK